MNETQPLLRTVRSFMRREGRMTKIQKNAIAELWSQYGLELGTQFYDLDTVFKRSAPRVLEIGFGMGQSLFIQAQQQPDCDFIGIEVHRPGIGNLLVAAAENNLTNLRVFCADALHVLAQVLPDNSFDKVQLFFPDPWPKRRHHKRRLVQAEFVALIRQKLKPNGIFHLATDWQDYANQMLAVLSAAPGFINKFSANNFAPTGFDRPSTKFEQRGKKLGYGVWDLVFIKQ